LVLGNAILLEKGWYVVDHVFGAVRHVWRFDPHAVTQSAQGHHPVEALPAR
jgi:hypothetical protein